jgi:nitroimidazol reductase NimA-like FMN-containing flavoprotein (pyridoxamine 5'-phosphate oxidase superfamily)
MHKAPVDSTLRSPSGIEILSARDCETFLANTTTVGRLAFRSSRGLQLLPVNYVYRNGCVYFKTSPKSLLAELSDGCSEVVFETDRADEHTHLGWSVVLRGKARAVDPGEVDLSPRGPNPWAAGPREILIEIAPDHVTGRTIRTPRQRPSS